MANETTSLFGSLPESQTNDGKIILHTDNGAERSSVALSELVGGGSCIVDGGTLIDNSTIDVQNNASSTLTSEQETLTLNVNVDEGEVPNFVVEILAETNIELTVTKTVGEGTPVTLYASSIGGSSLVSGKYYQVSCIGNCWTLAEFIIASPTPTPPDPNPLNLPSHTIRVKFKQGYNPADNDAEIIIGDSRTLVDANENIWDITKNSNDWSNFLKTDEYAVLEVLGANATGVTNMEYMFFEETELTSIAYFDTSSVTCMRRMFGTCSSLQTVPNFDTSNVTIMTGMFEKCSAITTLPLFDTSKVTDMTDICKYCENLIEIPDFDCSSLEWISYGFEECTKVTTGILRLYNKLKDIQGLHYDSVFYNCGIDTETGRAELAEIPSDWKE